VSEAKDQSPEAVAAGLEDARATLAEIWRRTEGETHTRAMRALQAVISAEQTMQAADAFLAARTPRARRAAFEELRKKAIFRVGHDVRPYP
jgi:hypothetical protein